MKDELNKENKSTYHRKKRNSVQKYLQLLLIIYTSFLQVTQKYFLTLKTIGLIRSLDGY